MHKWFIFLFFVSFNGFAQEFPVYLQDMLVESQESFESYAKKSPGEIEDGVYDETEYFLFSQLEQIASFDIVFTKEVIREFKKSMVLLLVQSFDANQLSSIVKIGKSKHLNKKHAANYFEVALEYKLGKLKEINFH